MCIRDRAATANTGAVILLAVEPNNPTVVVDEATIQAALEDMGTRNGLKITRVEIEVEANTDGT